MPTQVQFRRGTTAQNNSFTGALGELSVDTDLDVIRVHDGSTAGGFALVGATSTQTLTNKTFSGNTNFAGNILPTGNANANIGSTTLQFNTVHAKATSAQYADLAERYQSDYEYPAGTVLVFNGDQEVTQSTINHDTAVAGVVSADPAYIMNSQLQTPNSVIVALAGRVPCLVLGPVNKGTVLVTSDVPGTAQAIDYTKAKLGSVIGKAMQSIQDNSIKTIEISVGRS